MTEHQLFQSAQFKENLKKYENALQQGSSVYLEPDEFMDIADFYNMRNEQGKALEAIGKAMEIFPYADAPIISMSRMMLVQQQDIDQAKAYADKVTDKNDIEYLYLIAEILLNEDKEEQADAYLKEKADGLPTEEMADYALDVASLFADYEVYEKAERWLSKASKDDEELYTSIEGRIAFYRKDYAKASALFNKLIDTDPFSAHYWNLLAASQFLQDKIHNSIQSSEYALAIEPDNEEALLNKANGLFGLTNFKDALKTYERYQQVNDQDETAEMLIGITLLNMNETTKALEHLMKAARKVKPGSDNRPEIYRELSFALSKLGHTAEAIEFIKSMEGEGKDDAELNVLRGYVYLENEKEELAKHYFTKALEESNHSFDTRLGVAVSYFDCGYLHHAYQMLKNLYVNIDQSWKDGYSYLAYCCRSLHLKEEYLEALQIACQRNPREARLVLADCFPPTLDPEDYYQYELDNYSHDQ